MAESPDANRIEEKCSRASLSLAELQGVFLEMRSDLLRFLKRRIGNGEIAADLTQDVFVKLSSVLALIPDRRHGRSYLFRMAGNLAIDYHKIENRRAEILSGSQVLFEDDENDSQAIVIARDELRRVEVALSELPERCRQVLVLAQIQGLTHKEIAVQLGVSISLVEKYRLRAVRHCRERLLDSR